LHENNIARMGGLAKLANGRPDSPLGEYSSQEAALISEV
jgi:hypothetical protein